MNKSKLKKYIDQLATIEPTAWKDLSGKFEPVVYQKDEKILSVGEVETCIYFLNRGLVRKFVPTGEEKSISIGFFFENSFFSDYNSFLTGSPSFYSIEALTEIEILKINRENLFNLYEKYNSINTLGRIVTQNFFLEVLNYMTDSISLSGEERYKKILAVNPEFIQQVPVKYLSSFLGLHPNSLSRIRSKVK